MTARLQARTWVGALIRHANSVGDYATVVRRGDAMAGQIILVARRHDGFTKVFTRTLQNDGAYSWSVAAESSQEEVEKVNEYLARQARYDPDLWIVELDTANPERFVDDELI